MRMNEWELMFFRTSAGNVYAIIFQRPMLILFDQPSRGPQLIPDSLTPESKYFREFLNHPRLS